MEKKAKLPVGIENFEKLRTENFYYVDKTGLIKELLDNWGEVNLFTRPRRFGKSLNMNMLRYFFEYGCRAEIFDGLEISKEKAYCEKYMGKFPVISITLKGVDARDFEGAKDMLRSIIGDEAMRFQFLLGMSDVYCPWDVINYCRELRFDREAYPRAFWINTSGNDSCCGGGAVWRILAQDNQYLGYCRKKEQKREFLPSILLGLLGHREDWIVTSNAESGDGYSDILVELAEEGIGIVTEVKYAEEGLLEAACTEALVQIARMDYDAWLRQDGMDTIIRYRKGRCLSWGTSIGSSLYWLLSFLGEWHLRLLAASMSPNSMFGSASMNSAGCP